MNTAARGWHGACKEVFLRSCCVMMAVTAMMNKSLSSMGMFALHASPKTLRVCAVLCRSAMYKSGALTGVHALLLTGSELLVLATFFQNNHALLVKNTVL